MKRIMLVVMILVLVSSANAETYKDRGVDELATQTIDFDATAGVFAENFRDGNHVDGYWAVGTIFPQSNKKKFGLVVERSGWSGETSDGYKYNGSRMTFGPAFRSVGTNSQTEFRLGYGAVRDDGRKAELTGTYESAQDTRIISTYFASEIRGEKKWLARKKIMWAGDFDISNVRNDSWTDTWGKRKIGTAPENKSMVSVRVDSEVLALNNGRNIIIGSGISGIYYFINANIGIRPEIGLYFWDRAVEARGYYTDWSKDDDSYGGGVTVNVSNLLKKLEKKDKEVINLDDMDMSEEVLEGN